MSPTRQQVFDAIHEAGDGVAHVSDQYESALADAVMALLESAPQPEMLSDVSMRIEDRNGTVYLVQFAGCATADGRLLPHPHTPQPGCIDVYHVVIEAVAS